MKPMTIVEIEEQLSKASPLERLGLTTPPAEWTGESVATAKDKLANLLEGLRDVDASITAERISSLYETIEASSKSAQKDIGNAKRLMEAIAQFDASGVRSHDLSLRILLVSESERGELRDLQSENVRRALGTRADKVIALVKRVWGNSAQAESLSLHVARALESLTGSTDVADSKDNIPASGPSESRKAVDWGRIAPWAVAAICIIIALIAIVSKSAMQSEPTTSREQTGNSPGDTGARVDSPKDNMSEASVPPRSEAKLSEQSGRTSSESAPSDPQPPKETRPDAYLGDSVSLCSESLMLANPECPSTISSSKIQNQALTNPTTKCSRHIKEVILCRETGCRATEFCSTTMSTKDVRVRGIMDPNKDCWKHTAQSSKDD